MANSTASPRLQGRRTSHAGQAVGRRPSQFLEQQSRSLSSKPRLSFVTLTGQVWEAPRDTSLNPYGVRDAVDYWYVASCMSIITHGPAKMAAGVEILGWAPPEVRAEREKEHLRSIGGLFRTTMQKTSSIARWDHGDHLGEGTLTDDHDSAETKPARSTVLAGVQGLGSMNSMRSC